MALFEDELNELNELNNKKVKDNFKKNEKKSKFFGNPIKFIVLISVFLVLLAIMIYVMIVYLKSTIITYKLNGNADNNISKAIIINEDSSVSVSIMNLARILGYSIHTGEYQGNENENVGYMEYNNIVVQYEKDSNVIKQYYKDESSNNMIYLKLDDAISSISGDMILTSADAEKILSIKIAYNNKSLNINTFEYLYDDFQNRISSGSSLIERIDKETTRNKVAVIDDMLIIENSNKKFGVISTKTGKYIIEDKYSEIQYNRESSEFLVTVNNQKGVITSEGKAKIANEYEDIVAVSLEKKMYYIVKNNSGYGLLDSAGKTVIYPEYEKIGLDDTTTYKNNNLESPYLIANTFIPLKIGNVYVFYNIKNNKIEEFDFKVKELGCKSKETSKYSTIQIPEYKIMVVGDGEKFALIDENNNFIKGYGFVFDSVYYKTSAGVKTYFVSIVKDDKTYEFDIVEKLLK